MKFKGNVKEMKTFLRDGLITSNGGTKFKFVDGEGIVEEHESDYRKILAEVNFETGNVEFHDAGNYMEVPIEIIQEVSRLIEIK